MGEFDFEDFIKCFKGLLLISLFVDLFWFGWKRYLIVEVYS